MRRDVLVIIALGSLSAAASLAVSPDWRGLFGAALALLMLAIAIGDLRHLIVPNALTATAFALALISAGTFDAAGPTEAVAIALLRAAATALPLLALMVGYEWWRGRPGLGMGDVKLAAVAGAWLDWLTIAGVIEVAALTALAAYAIWRFVLRRPIAVTTPLPFGLFLAPAIWAGWVAEILLAPHRY